MKEGRVWFSDLFCESQAIWNRTEFSVMELIWSFVAGRTVWPKLARLFIINFISKTSTFMNERPPNHQTGQSWGKFPLQKLQKKQYGAL